MPGALGLTGSGPTGSGPTGAGEGGDWAGGGRAGGGGLPRRTPLACMPEDGGTWVLVGGNVGRPGHPAWTANLLAHPEAESSWTGRSITVRARLLEGAERESAWAAVLAFWPP